MRLNILQFSLSSNFSCLRTKYFPLNFVIKQPQSVLDLYFNLFKCSNAIYKSIPCFAYYYNLSDPLNMFLLLTTRYITMAVCLKMTYVLWCLIYCKVSVLSTGDICMSVAACSCVDRLSEGSFSLGSYPQFHSSLKRSVFWDITPYSPLKINRRFGRTCLHLQGRRISQARNQHESGWQAEPRNVSWLSPNYKALYPRR
jgi:hypothetical protein